MADLENTGRQSGIAALLERNHKRTGSGLSEDTAEQCQRMRHDGVGTVIGEEMCRAVDDVAGEVVRLAAVDIEHARPDAGISAAHE